MGGHYKEIIQKNINVEPPANGPSNFQREMGMQASSEKEMETSVFLETFHGREETTPTQAWFSIRS